MAHKHAKPHTAAPERQPPRDSAALPLPLPLQDYEQRLREAGQLITVQRRAILRYLLRQGGHHTTAQIAAAVGRVGAASLATVYNNLALFARLHILTSVRAPEGEQYWDLRTDPHHHLSCRSCGRISDVDAAAAEVVLHDARLRQRTEEAAIWLRGACEHCARRPS
jgi:Fe2+ or Zn2+ uptake regulation protein